MAAARALLDALAERLGEATLAVLAGAPGERAVVLDLRGADEPPWPEPLSGDAALARVWGDGAARAST